MPLQQVSQGLCVVMRAHDEMSRCTSDAKGVSRQGVLLACGTDKLNSDHAAISAKRCSLE